MPEVIALEELLAAVARQDVEAFRALYDLTSARMMGIALRICRDRASAEDVVQDSYVQVWRRAQLFDPGRGSAMGWMCSIARHRAIDLVRSRSRDLQRLSADDSESLADIPALLAAGATRDDMRSLYACLRELSPQHAEAVLLAYFHGLSRDELAQRYNIPENTVKTWLRRGLIALRTCMDKG